MGPWAPAGDIARGTYGSLFTHGGPVGGPATVGPVDGDGYLTVSATGSSGVAASIRFPFPSSLGTLPVSATLTLGASSCDVVGALTTRAASRLPDGSPDQLVADFGGKCPLFDTSTFGPRGVAAAVRINAADYPVALPAADNASFVSNATVGDPVSHTVRVRNDGQGPWSITDAGIGSWSTSKPLFAVDSASDTCTGHVLAPGATCSVTVNAIATASAVREHLVVRGDAPVPLVVPMRLEGHPEIATPTAVTAQTSRANTWVGWTAAVTAPKVGYRIYDVTDGARRLLGTAPLDSTSLVVASVPGRTLVVVAADGALAESRDVAVTVPRAGSTEIVGNAAGGFDGALFSDAAGGQSRPLVPYGNYRLNPARDMWLTRWGNAVHACSVRTELCSPVVDFGQTVPDTGVLMEAAWLPDGRIIMLRGASPATRTLWAIHADGTNLARLTNASKLDRIAVAPSGQEVVGVDTDSATATRVRLSDGARTMVPNTLLTDGVSVSMQGRLVVITGDGTASGRTTTRVMNLDGSAAKTLPLPPGENRYAALDPTGTRLVWSRWTDWWAATVWVANADGSQARQLGSAVGPWHDLVWSAPDTAAPVAALTGPPASLRQVTLTVGATDRDSAGGSLRRECQLDSSTAWTACGPTWTISNLSVATHTARARVADPVGHLSAPSSLTWRVDLVAPTAAITPPAVTQLATSMRLQWSSADTGGAGVKNHDIRIRTAPLGAGFGSYTYPASVQALASTSATVTLAQGSQYCFSARARDTVGNLGAWSAERCTVVAFDDARLAASTGWSRGRSSSYAFGTYSTIARAGATLSTTGAQGRRISVVVTTCASCGAVDVYHAGHLIGRLNLYSSTTRFGQERSLPAQTLTRTGTVTLKTVTAKRVYVDAIVVRH